MTRSRLNLFIDVTAFIGFVMLTTTGVLIHYILPPGSGRFRTIWGLDRHAWGDIHFWISVAFLGVLTLHLILHRRWIVSMLTGRPREGSGVRIALGFVGLAGVVAFAVSPLLSPVDVTRAGDAGRKSSFRHQQEGTMILGSMTLDDVEKNTGVPAEHIIRQLMLPVDTSTQERIGRLRREHGFKIDDVRRIVGAYGHERHEAAP